MHWESRTVSSIPEPEEAWSVQVGHLARGTGVVSQQRSPESLPMKAPRGCN